MTERLSNRQFQAVLTGDSEELVRIIGLFFGGVTGEAHAAAAVATGRALIRAVGRPDATPAGPMPVGAAVHTGIAYVGTTGPEGAVSDFTALGDAVNTTSRIAAEAIAGELL